MDKREQLIDWINDRIEPLSVRQAQLLREKLNELFKAKAEYLLSLAWESGHTFGLHESETESENVEKEKESVVAHLLKEWFYQES